MVLHKPCAADRGPLVFDDVPRPAAPPDGLLVRVGACGVCRTDLHEVEGELEMSRLPIIPGHQIVGTVEAKGAEAVRFAEGEPVGIAWLHRTCGTCAFCTDSSDRENLCESAEFTGWSVNGGYAEYAVVPDAFAYRIPDSLPPDQAAPLLCAGIIGYRALRLTGVKRGQRLGLYGFGGSAHIAIQIACHWGCEVHVFTRSEANRELAGELGAAWVGGVGDRSAASSLRMDASVVFAPAGELVLDALENLTKGGTVALAGICMSAIPQMDYAKHLYDEKVLRSVANATRRDGEELLALASKIPIRTVTRTFPLEQANDALEALKAGGLGGAAVLLCDASTQRH
ncbi:MAG: zinc-dependent alcohol dehydrogenase family protein [Phycisphaerae bacterium]